MGSLGKKLGLAAGSDGRTLIPHSKLYAEKQVREKFDEENIRGLAASIKAEGQIQPVTVRPRDKNGGYLIVTGERRWRACVLLDKDVWVVEQKEQFDKPTTLIVQLVENVQRDDLTLKEKVNSVSSLINEHGLKQSDIARRMGLPKPTISKMATIASMPEVVSELYEESVCENLDTLATLVRLHEVAPSECARYCYEATQAGFAKRSSAEQLLRQFKKPKKQSPANFKTEPGDELNETEDRAGESEAGPLLSAKKGSEISGGRSSKTQALTPYDNSAVDPAREWIVKDPRDLTLQCEVSNAEGERPARLELDKIDKDKAHCWVCFDDQPDQPVRVLCASVRLIGFSPNARHA